jgi:hypothetical protein
MIRNLTRTAVAILLLLASAEVRAQQVRKIAPGVLKVIPSEPLSEETFQGPVPLVNVSRLDWDPHFSPKSYTLREMAAKTVLRRNIWALEFAFKPLRMIQADIPQPTGKMQRKLIWYMVYRITNKGQHIVPVAMKDNFGHKTYGSQKSPEVINTGAVDPSGEIRFFPQFVFESLERKKAYLDRVIPVVMPLVEQRETGGGKLFSTVEISRLSIPVSTPTADRSVWGVAMWEDIDPETDFFSIYVQGLTNAYRLGASPSGGAAYLFKTLQLNFWRPSDQFFEHEREIRYGIPAVSNPEEQAKILANYGISQRLDYLWVYR